MAKRLNTKLLVRLLIFGGVPLAIVITIFFVAPSSWWSGGDPDLYVKEARSCMEAAQLLESKNPPPFHATAEWTQAWLAIRNAVKLGAGKKAEVQFLLGQIAMHQTPPAGPSAIQAFRQAVKLKPDYVEPQRELAKLYLGSHYWKEARSEIALLIQMDPSDGNAYLWAAYVELAAAEAEPIQSKRVPFYEVVVERCRTGIQKAPELLELYLRMALAYEKLSQPEKVVEVMDLAI
ncbi:MAG: hypothetical protein NT049_08135, partial [Planctomycetota bacterium]|nr:hypothetical protein [Planctomycetota bacterium]